MHLRTSQRMSNYFDEDNILNDEEQSLHQDEESVQNTGEWLSRSNREKTWEIDLFSNENLGLFAHYAATGLLYSLTSRPSRAACNKPGYFVDSGLSSEDLQFFCNNLGTLVRLPWSFKLFFALVVDLIWPCGYRRKPFIVVGWIVAMTGVLYVAIFIKDLTVQYYSFLLLGIQFFFMFANVAADGYCIQLALMGLEGRNNDRGYVLLTGQAIRFGFSVVPSFIIGFLMNGQELNLQEVTGNWNEAWNWGITLQQYYFIALALLFLLFIPMVRMHEIKDTSREAKHRTAPELFRELWVILKNKTTFNLLIYGILLYSFASMPNRSQSILQSQVVGTPLLVIGVEGSFYYAALSFGVLACRDNLIKENWREVHLYSRMFFLVYELILWILGIYNVFGLRNAWFIAFINITGSFLTTISKYMLSVAIIEICKPGMETSIYQLIISAINGSITVGSVLGNQLYAVFMSGKNVDLSSQQKFDETKGPCAFTKYTIILTILSIASVFIGTLFLPANRKMCKEWANESVREDKSYARSSFILAFLFTLYGFSLSMTYFFPDIACSEFVGGGGCQENE